MKLIILSIVFFSFNAFALDACVFRDEDDTISLKCTYTQDSRDIYVSHNSEHLNLYKVEQIKILLEKGYSLKSENIYVK